MKRLVLLVAVLALVAGGAYAQCGQQGPDSEEGADMEVLSGSYTAGSEVTIAMTLDGVQSEIVESGWWESRANNREDGGVADFSGFIGLDNDPEENEPATANPDGSITFTLTQGMIDGLGTGASGYIEACTADPELWIYYNFDELCFDGAADECDCDWEAALAAHPDPYGWIVDEIPGQLDWDSINDPVPFTGTVAVGETLVLTHDGYDDLIHLVDGDCNGVTDAEPWEFWGNWDQDPGTVTIPVDLYNGEADTLGENHFGLWAIMSDWDVAGANRVFLICPSGAAPEGEIDYPPPVPEGAPVAGMLGLGLVAAACALGGAMTLRKK